MKIFKASTTTSSICITLAFISLLLVGIATATSFTCTIAQECEEDPKSTFIFSIKKKRGAVPIRYLFIHLFKKGVKVESESSIISTKSCAWLAKEKNAKYIESLCNTDISHGDAGQAAYEACPITCGIFDPPTNNVPTDDDESALGPLEDLVGMWEGNQGFVLISLPEQGSVPSDNLKADTLGITYRETFEIKSLGKMGTPNKGGSINQAVGACNYTKTVWRTDQTNNTDNQAVIHEEDGMFFYLENIKTNIPGQDSEPVGIEDKAPYAVSRSAVVPHGNTAMVFGNVTKLMGPPSILETKVVTIPFTVPPSRFPAFGYGEISESPLLILHNSLQKGPTVSNTVHFSMSSQNGGGIINTNFITKRSDTRNYRVDIWVEDIGNGRKQLQYAEQVDLIFHKNKVGSEELDIVWPHVMVNTLTKI